MTIYVVVTRLKRNPDSYSVYRVEPSYFAKHFDVPHRDFDFALEPYCKYIAVESEEESKQLRDYLKDFFGIYPPGLPIDKWLAQRTKEELDFWKQYWTEKFAGYSCLISFVNAKYNEYYPNAPEKKEEPKPDWQVSIPEKPKEPQKELIDIEIGFLNAVNWTTELLENIKNWINNIVNMVGWNCYSAIGNGNKLTLRFEKTGSPALPIFAIIMVVAILTGAIIVSVSWKAVRLAEEETKQELAKLEQLKTNKDLLELVTDEYNRGLIDEETYKDLLIQMGYSNVNITKPKPSEEKEGFGWEDIPQMMAGFVPIMLLFLLISSIKK